MCQSTYKKESDHTVHAMVMHTIVTSFGSVMLTVKNTSVDAVIQYQAVIFIKLGQVTYAGAQHNNGTVFLLEEHMQAKPSSCMKYA